MLLNVCRGGSQTRPFCVHYQGAFAASTDSIRRGDPCGRPRPPRGASTFFSRRRKESSKEKGGKRRGLKSRPLLSKPPRPGGDRLCLPRTWAYTGGRPQGSPLQGVWGLARGDWCSAELFFIVEAGSKPARIARVAFPIRGHLLHRPILFVGATLAVARSPAGASTFFSLRRKESGRLVPAGGQKAPGPAKFWHIFACSFLK